MSHPRRVRLVALSVATALSFTTFAFGQTKEGLHHPEVMRMTVSGGPFYWTFTANQNGTYAAVLSNAAANNVTVATGTMTLDKFTADSAAMRIMVGGHIANATGTISGNNLLSGSWRNDAGQSGTFTATWDGAVADASHAAPGQESMVVMTECEGVNNCAIWKFSGKKGIYMQGIGTWPSGQTASLLLTITDGTVTIERKDPDTGYAATYTGKQDNDGISGKFASSAPVAKSGNWYAMLGNPWALPAAMKFCGPYACQDLRLNNGKYESVGPDGNPTWSVWTVEQFTPQGVRITRVDPDGYIATLTGQISPAGSSIINGQQAGNRGGTAPFTLTWGSAYGMAQKTSAPAQTGSGGGISAEQQVAGMNLFTAILNAYTFGGR